MLMTDDDNYSNSNCLFGRSAYLLVIIRALKYSLIYSPSTRVINYSDKSEGSDNNSTIQFIRFKSWQVTTRLMVNHRFVANLCYLHFHV